MLIDDIKDNWNRDILGYAQVIASLKNSSFPAWTVRLADGYGVAIPYVGEDVNESFSNARIFTADNIMTASGVMQRVLVLTTGAIGIEHPFAALCAELIEPGEEGNARAEIVANPVSWWRKWKELLGNKNIDARIYDVLGELCVLYEVLKSGEDADWNGPDGASYDIETESRFVEVKSTISRNKREVVISSDMQLDPKHKPLDLVLCVFEPTMHTGISIDSIIAKFSEMGYNTDILNQKLSKLGFEAGMSARKRTFILHEMLRYSIGSDFPRVTSASFIGGVLPAGITKITYTVDLSGIQAELMVQGANNDIQND